MPIVGSMGEDATDASTPDASTPDGASERVPGAVSRLAARAPWRRLPHPLRWLTVALIGGTFVVVGIALLVLPGPGIAFILIGLAILATEFVWAEALLHRVKKGTHRVWSTARSKVRPTKRANATNPSAVPPTVPTPASTALPQPE
jgi:uncharacterized protein (TIGR02611 family)